MNSGIGGIFNLIPELSHGTIKEWPNGSTTSKQTTKGATQCLMQLK